MILCILAQAKYERDEHLGKNYFWHEWRDLKEIKNKIWRKASWFKLGQITIIWSEYFICILGEELYINKSEIFTALKMDQSVNKMGNWYISVPQRKVQEVVFTFQF